jgi:hypothetical protein
MRSPSAAVCAAVWFVTLAAAPVARADLINWSYSWSNSPTNVTSDTNTKSYVQLSNESLTDATNGTDIVATNLLTFSNASPDKPDSFTNRKYSLQLTIIDQDSGKSGTIVFNGEFNGSLSSASSDLKNTFLGKTTFSIILGDHEYTVTINSYTPPGPPSSTNAGAIAAHANVVVSLVNTPEPGTLSLLLLGTGLLCFTQRRRWGQQRASRRSSSPAG